MKKLILRHRAQLRNLLLYVCIGICGASLDFAIFTLLNHGCGVHYQLANCLSVTAGIMLSFTLNSRFNFKKTDHLLKRFISFYGVGLTGLSISATILYCFIGLASVHQFGTSQLLQLGIFENSTQADNIYTLLVKFGSIGIVTLVQFTLNKLYSFREIKA